MLRKYGISVDLNLFSVFDNLNQGVSIQDKSGQLVYINTRAAELMGQKAAKPFLATSTNTIRARFIIQDEDGQLLPMKELPGRKALQTGKIHQQVVHFIIKRSGREYWSLVKAQPLFNEQKEISGVINFFDDMTSVKKTEQQYKFFAKVSDVMAQSINYESRLESFAKLVVPSLVDWCVIDILDGSGVAKRLIAVNQDPEKVALSKKLWTHYPPNPNSETGFYKAIKNDKAEVYSDITDEMISSATVDQQHLSWLRQLNLKSIMLLPLIARGKKLGLMSLGTDGSGRKLEKKDLDFYQKLADRVAVLADNARLYSALSREMQKQKIVKNTLQKSEEKFASIFQTNFSGMLLFNTQGLITEVNEAASKLLRRSPKNLLHLNISKLISPANPAEFEQLWAEHSLELRKKLEIRWTTGSEDPKELECSVVRYITPQLHLLMIEDVTDRKIEEKRREHFLGITSHELKSPLTSIKSIAQLLKSQLKTADEETKLYLTEMDKNVDHLTRLVNDLLDVTRIRHGKLEFLYEVLDFNTILNDVIQEILLVKSEWKIDKKGGMKREFIGDRGRIMQVLRNLIWNAIKYAPNSKEITITLVENKKTFTVKVQDFGPGVSLPDKERIFELYYRSTHTEESHKKGLGVGLFISHQIIKQMGGKIGVSSKVGHGSTFIISLPFMPPKQLQHEKNIIH